MSKKGLIITLFLLLLPTVSALEMNVNPTEAIQKVGMFLQLALANQYVVFVFVVVFLYILFYAIVAAAVGKIKLFEGEGAAGVNTFGKMIANAMAAFIVMAYIYLNRDMTLTDRLDTLLGPNRWIAAFVFTLLFLLWMRKTFEGDNAKALMATGLGSWGISILLNAPNMLFLGVICFVLGLFLWLKQFAPMTLGQRQRARKSEFKLEKKLWKTAKDQFKRDKKIKGYEEYLDSLNRRDLADEQVLERYLPYEENDENLIRNYVNAMRQQQGAAQGQPRQLRVRQDLANNPHFVNAVQLLIQKFGVDEVQKLVNATQSQPIERQVALLETLNKADPQDAKALFSDLERHPKLADPMLDFSHGDARPLHEALDDVRQGRITQDELIDLMERGKIKDLDQLRRMEGEA